jgi:hypothetical protein
VRRGSQTGRFGPDLGLVPKEYRGRGLVVTVRGMRRALLAIAAGFLIEAVVTRLAEAAGVGQRHCGCEPDCWCKQPALTLFLWVTPPRTHRLVSPDYQRTQAEGLSQ